MRKILVLAGPSAVGKTTVMKRILSVYNNFELVRSATTRAPRGDGHDGEYIYLSESEFKSKIENGEMLEYTEYSGNLYGTPYSELKRIFGKGRTPLLILDINGVLSLKNTPRDFKTVAVYITADTEILDARLKKRAEVAGNTEAALLTMEKRKMQNHRDLQLVSKLTDKFDAVIRNDDIEICADSINKIFCEK
ncbi:MAG: hypothetical protein E7612_06995 [Ruminococcaceae bacterium]|nr:hypothetical protein [Oscillospiraceae bacterium]